VQEARKKTCLVLAPRSQIASHAALFERMAQAQGLERTQMAAGNDRAKSILQADLVLADVSGNEPEILYYVGVAHTFGKRVFLVSDTLDGLPFDIASSRVWLVDATSDNRDILQAMEQFLSVPYAIGPVRIFLGKFAFFGENLIKWRFFAFLLDALLMLLLLGLVLLLVVHGGQATLTGRVDFLLQSLRGGPGDTTGELVQTIVIFAGYAVVAYFALSTWLLRATFGQYAMGLRVVQTDYRRATFGQCAGRAALLVVVLITWGAAFLWAIRGPGYRAAHDALSGTIVVRRHAF